MESKIHLGFAGGRFIKIKIEIGSSFVRRRED
jgi:hypothetical protein